MHRRLFAAAQTAENEEVELTLTVNRECGRGNGSLGLELSDSNVILRLTDGSCCEGILEVGDTIVGVDGVEVGGRQKLADVIMHRRMHTFRVLRLRRRPGAGRCR